MNKDDFKKICKGLKAAYPAANFLPDDYTVAIWYKMLGHLDYAIMSNAVQRYIATEHFPPTISDILERVRQIAQGEELTESEAWAIVMKAISNSAYNSVTEFEKLSPAVKKAVGNAATLKEWAISEDFNAGVESSNFKRSYKIAIQREKELAQLPPTLRAATLSLMDNMDVKKITGES